MKKIIDVTETSYIHLFLNNLIFTKNGVKIMIPTKDIETLIIENTHLTISIALINKLVDNGVNIIICDEKHLPNALLIPYHKYYSVKNLQNQITWNLDFKTKAWQLIVKTKIFNSLKILKTLKLLNKENEDKIINYSNSIVGLDFSNAEAHVAKLYFKLLFGEKFKRSDEENFINRYLNYGYSILLSYIVRSLCNKGFDVRLGLFHKSYSNNFALATDIIEPFRCLIDLHLYKYIKSNELLSFKDYKKVIFDIFEEFIFFKNENVKVSKYIDLFVEEILVKNNFEKELYFERIKG
ncbi:CRISPR-associated endonuclease Cas1, subtype II/NMENI [Mycoplasmopsis maculosa]|uniref:CRISPR-associated endonuclease Cas1 n=1 Tax=Mycoplasmopsis maculosa TaxID=114885 RepID=A0A449B4M6_9BACT|nr:type II CRISPR-associated endonuclease Cas1 [Mycoplasmopsis maculosa]VEU75557.1 CRISPR-associated endonuclease Cas1, subtype II/NMENI [Mycoplasmopsis maculosa]